MEKSIQFNFKPIGGEIEKAGLRSTKFLKSHGFSDKAVNTQIRILRELINSGINYGQFTPSENEIIVNIFISEKTITLEVKNPVDDTCIDRLQELEKTIQLIRGYIDPFEPYLIKQREVAKNSSTQASYELGLAKIAYEGGAMLDFFVGDDNFMQLFAVRNID